MVVHLAGVVHADSNERYRAINRDAVADLVECLARQDWAPRRLLFASSLAAAGPSTRTRAWTETDLPQPIEPYGEAKAAAEAIVSEAPFPTTSFRPPLVFGPGDPATLTLYKAARSGVGACANGEPQRLSFVDVRDAVEGIVCMAEDTRSGNYTYFLSHPHTTDIRELWHTLGDVVGSRVVVLPLSRRVLYGAMRISTIGARIFGYHNQFDDKQYRQMLAPAFTCSSEALRADLRWDPRHGLRDALSNAARGYRDAGLLRR